MLNNTDYDISLELAVCTFNLDMKGRKEEFIDMKHFLVKWWDKNRKKFIKYKTMTSVSELMMVHHSTINHLQKHRKKSLRYDENIKFIKEFLKN